MKKTTKSTVNENCEKVIPQGECVDAAGQESLCEAAKKNQPDGHKRLHGSDEDDEEFTIYINPLFD